MGDFASDMRCGLPAGLAALLTPRAYPHPVAAVELIATHISWVLLAGEFAYKIKRPVRYPFVDLRAPERREFYCEEELRLNRRFAPELYLEVCRITSEGGEARIGGEGPVLEHAVRMRRFDRSAELDRLLERLEVETQELEAFGRQLAVLHAGLPAAPSASAWGRPEKTQALMVRNLRECAEAARAFGTSERVLALQERLQGLLRSATAPMALRRMSGRIRECHGDLHSRNIVRLRGRLVPFDCLEYEPAFRWIDVADEVAFLASDLAARRRPLHAHAFVSGYLAQSGDYHACRVLRLYEAHRALVRAKVAALSTHEVAEGPERESLGEEHARLLAHAAAALAQRAPVLLLMCGLSGSGKTWLARQLAERLSAIPLRSDVERKRRAGLDAAARSGSGIAAGLYSSRTSLAVYEDLERAAEDALAGGYTVVVDATFLRRQQRERFAGLGGRLGIRAHLVYCDAPVPVLRARIAARGRGGLDPSEADEAVLEWQLSHLEPLTPEERLEVVRVETAEPQALERALQALGSPTPHAPGVSPGR